MHSKNFEQSLEFGCLPDDWKVGNIIRLYKNDDKHCPSNCRPISLANVPCKILEHVIYSHLGDFVESNSFLCSSPHGFRKPYSSETHLLSFTQDLRYTLDPDSQADCIFLHFSEAFDKVFHKLLIFKPRSLRIDNIVLKWIECFLTTRSQLVSTNDTNSHLTRVSSGIPEGSVLGPL